MFPASDKFTPLADEVKLPFCNLFTSIFSVRTFVFHILKRRFPLRISKIVSSDFCARLQISFFSS
jgi:hypothetical protein